MKRVIAILLALTCIAVLLPAGVQVNAETVDQKPFYLLNWMPVSEDVSDYVLECAYFSGYYPDGSDEPVISFEDFTKIEDQAAALKEMFDARPEGTRHVYLNHPFKAIYELVEDYIYFNKATAEIKEWVEAFFAEYSRIGGKLDGIYVDVEYVYGNAYYIHTEQFEKGNMECYWEIVNNPLYKTTVRPKLEKWGFTFWGEAMQDDIRSEIWTMSGSQGMEKEQSIWDHVVEELMADCLNESIFEPMLKYYPDALFCDYGRLDSTGWQKTHGGTMVHSTGNGSKVGNVSNRQCYPYEPWENWIGQYNTPEGFNHVKYDATPYNVALWGVMQTNKMYEADSNHRISSWMTFFNFQPEHPGSASNTPYYSETIYHIGLLDPQPFYGYILEDEVWEYGIEDPDPMVSDYDYAIQIAGELMAELTRVAGFADRKPIYVPTSWNSHFMLSGMYANGRNIWRITPDVYTGTSVENFKVKDNDPTFYIAGQTITFPQGKIIADSKISQVGSCGYWVETPADVTPVITGDADRYEKDPSFMENFEKFKDGSVFNETVADAWKTSGDTAIESHNGSMALALTGNAQIINVKAPANITAGDKYAQQQAWQMQVTVPDGGELILLRCSHNDLGVKIADGKVYYGNNKTYEELPGVSVSAGSTYIIKREVDFRVSKNCISTYTVYDASGNELGKKSAPIASVSLPVSEIACDAIGVTGTAYIDNYKLYPTGVTTDFMVYDAATGYELKDADEARNEDSAYRLSWLNGTGKDVVAKVYNSGALVGEFTLGAGQDGVITGIVKSEGKPVLLTVETEGEPNGDNGGDQTPDSTNPPIQTPDDPDTKKDGLSAGMIALIIGVTAVLACGIVAVLVLVVLKPKKKESVAETQETKTDDPADSE